MIKNSLPRVAHEPCIEWTYIRKKFFINFAILRLCVRIMIIVRFYLFLCISLVESTRVTGRYSDIMSNKLTPFMKKNTSEKQKRKSGITCQAFLQLPGFLLQPMRDGLLLPSSHCFRSRSNPVKCTPHTVRTGTSILHINWQFHACSAYKSMYCYILCGSLFKPLGFYRNRWENTPLTFFSFFLLRNNGLGFVSS